MNLTAKTCQLYRLFRTIYEVWSFLITLTIWLTLIVASDDTYQILGQHYYHKHTSKDQQALSSLAFIYLANRHTEHKLHLMPVPASPAEEYHTRNDFSSRQMVVMSTFSYQIISAADMHLPFQICSLFPSQTCLISSTCSRTPYALFNFEYTGQLRRHYTIP